VTNSPDSMLPSNAEWWRAHQHMPPTLILRCGIDGCRERVGELKTDGDVAMVLLDNRFGERTVPYTPRVTEGSLGFNPETVLRDARTGETLEEQQDRRLAELDAETIRYVDGGRRVAKRYKQPSVHSLELFGHIVCPVHGVVGLPDPDATVARVRDFLGRSVARHASKRQYVIFRGNSLD
jgi:hypothetical protein